MTRGNPPRAPQQSCANNRVRLEERESDRVVDQNVLPKVELFECVEYRSTSEHFEMARGPWTREVPSLVSDQEHSGMRGLARS